MCTATWVRICSRTATLVARTRCGRYCRRFSCSSPPALQQRARRYVREALPRPSLSLSVLSPSLPAFLSSFPFVSLSPSCMPVCIHGTAQLTSVLLWTDTVQTQAGYVDHGYGYTSPTYQDSVVIFEKRADAVFYASLIAVQGAAPFEVASVDPRRVIVSAVTTGCKLSFNAAGSLLRY